MSRNGDIVGVSEVEAYFEGVEPDESDSWDD